MDVLAETNFPTYEKCGEVMTSYNIKKRLYTLKCLFCENRFSTLLDFVEHVEHVHILDLKKENCLPESDEYINSVLIEQKEECLEDDLNDSQVFTDPLTNTELNPSDKSHGEDDLFPNENCCKIEANDECSDVDDEFGNNSESSEGSDIDKDAKPGNSFLDSELDGNKDITLALIEGLEKLPVLWKKSSQQHEDNHKRVEALHNLAKNLNKTFGKRMKWTGIDERIKKLRSRFRSELINEKNAKSRGETFTPTWYFTKLEFLRSTIKSKGRRVKSAEKPARPIEVPLDDDQLIQLIKMYESFPCLWNTEDISFKSKTKREIAMQQIISSVAEKMQIKLTEKELLRKIKRLKVACTKEKLEIINCERSGTTHKPMLKYFSHISYLLDHVYPFKCPICSKTFKGFNMLRVHKSQHDGSSPFVCPICKKTLSSSVNLSIHIRRHNRDYTFECKPCSKKFATPEEYYIHERQHTGEKPYFCEICGKSFATCSLFGRHKRRHENRPTHICEICNRAFYEQIRYKEHMNVHNNVRDRICEICGKGFTHLKHLKTHKLIHSGRRDYVCKICGKDFAQSAGLYCHMKTHGAKMCDKTQTMLTK